MLVADKKYTENYEAVRPDVGMVGATELSDHFFSWLAEKSRRKLMQELIEEGHVDAHDKGEGGEKAWFYQMTWKEAKRVIYCADYVAGRVDLPLENGSKKRKLIEMLEATK